MAKVEREGEKIERAMEAEFRAREERSHRYDSERHEEEDDDELDDHEMFPQYMASHEPKDDDLPRSIEYSDLFDLDDPALEAELQLLSTPIADSVDELRRLQQSSDENGGVATPEATLVSWFTVGKTNITQTKSKNATYANAVKTRYGVTSAVPTYTDDPIAPRQSPRTAKKVRINGRTGTPPISTQPPKTKHATNPQSNTAVPQRKSALRKKTDGSTIVLTVWMMNLTLPCYP